LVDAGFSPRLLRDARLIVKWASDQVDGVIAGAVATNLSACNI
jgi:hypothetical protein